MISYFERTLFFWHGLFSSSYISGSVISIWSSITSLTKWNRHSIPTSFLTSVTMTVTDRPVGRAGTRRRRQIWPEDEGRTWLQWLALRPCVLLCPISDAEELAEGWA